MQISVVTFYHFTRWSDDQVGNIEKSLASLPNKFEAQALRGLIIMGREGINATLSILEPGAEQLQKEISQITGLDNIWFKVTVSPRHLFHDYLIKIRNEIVTLKRPDILPNGSHRHLSPTEWNQVIESEDPILIDTRNSYEYEVGHFKNAIDPKTEEFSEFPNWVEKANLPKDKKILIYCTGGIRCEKAIYALEEKGYKNAYQLDGGILNYLKEYPNRQYEGECFVFDYRVAVDQELRPTQKFKLCPHCGQPGLTPITCQQCGVDSVACDKCLAEKAEHNTCSKNCAHHFRMGHKTKRMHADSFRKRAP